MEDTATIAFDSNKHRISYFRDSGSEYYSPDGRKKYRVVFTTRVIKCDDALPWHMYYLVEMGNGEKILCYMPDGRNDLLIEVNSRCEGVLIAKRTIFGKWKQIRE